MNGVRGQEGAGRSFLGSPQPSPAPPSSPVPQLLSSSPSPSSSPRSPAPPLPSLPPLPSPLPPHLTFSAVASLLQGAQSVSDAERSAAQRALADAAQQVGYRTSLAFLALSPASVSDDLRLSAAIQLKNSIDAAFAPSATAAAPSLSASPPPFSSTFAAAEREWLKTALLDGLAESVDAISTQLGLCIAGIAKWEGGRQQWPALLPHLLSHCTFPDPLFSLRSSYVLLCVLKALQAKRTPMAKAAFATATASALPVVCSTFDVHSRALCASLQQSSSEGGGGGSAGGRISDERMRDIVAHSRMAVLHSKCLERCTTNINRHPLSPRHLRVLCAHHCYADAACRLIAYGVSDVSQSTDVRRVVSLLCEVVRFLFPLFSSVPPGHPLHPQLSSLLQSLVSVLSEAQKEQPLPFRVFLSDCAQLFDFLLVAATDAQGELLLEELTVRVLITLGRILRVAVYQKASASTTARAALIFSIDGGLKADPAAAAEAQDTFARLFTSAFCLHLCRLLMAKLFPFTPTELQHWADAAEQSILDAALDEEKVRPAALRLFGLLAQQHPDDVGSFVLHTAQQMLTATATSTSSSPSSPSSPSPAYPLSPPPGLPDDPAQLSALSSLYLALGCLCYDLPPRLGQSLPSFSFDSFYHQLARPQLLSLLKVTSTAPASTFSLSTSMLFAARCGVACRLFWCVGEWCESMSVQSHSAVYDAVGVGLGHTDLAVRFAAVRCLERFVVAVVGLDEGGQAQRLYSAYIEGVVRVCVGLIDELSELELQASVMQVVRHSVSSLHALVEPAVPYLLSALPFLWGKAGSANTPLRLVLLDTITELTITLGHRSEALQAFSCQSIAFSLDPKASDRDYLHHQALELWAAVMQTATSFTPQLLQLFPLLPAAFSEHSSLDLTESLPIALSLVESYALLGGRPFMGSQADTVAALIASWLERVGDKGLVLLTDTLEMLAHLFPAEFPRVFARPLHSLLRSLLDIRSYAELSDAEKAKASSQSAVGLASDLLCGHFLYVFSRLFFSNYDGGLELLQSLPGPQPSRAHFALDSLLRLWLEKLQSVAEVYARKLALLAIARVLIAQRQNEAILPFVVDWLRAVVDVQEELDQGEEDGGDAGLNGQPQQSSSAAGAEVARLTAGTEAERRRLLSEADPATSAALLSDGLSVLSELQRAQPSAFHHLVQQRMPPATQRRVEAFIAQQQRSAEQKLRASPLAATAPPAVFASTRLAPPTTSNTSSLSPPSHSLPTSHSHPALQSLHRTEGQM